MSTRDVGLPGIALAFWKGYGAVALGGLLMLALITALGGVAVLVFLPATAGYYAIAVVGLALHVSAWGLHDARTGRIDLETLDDLQIGYVELAVLVTLAAVYYTTIVASGAVAVILVARSGVSAPAAIVAIYVPVADIWLSRRFGFSPGMLVLRAFIYVAVELGAVRQQVTRLLPVIGKRRPPAA